MQCSSGPVRRAHAPATRHPAEDWDTPLWQDVRTTLVTTTNATGIPPHVSTVRAGIDDLDMVAALREMKRRGIDRLSCEGGPRINTTFLQADLFDEISLTVSPMAVGGTIQRTFADSPFDMRRYSLASHHADADWVFLRYLRLRE